MQPHILSLIVTGISRKVCNTLLNATYSQSGLILDLMSLLTSTLSLIVLALDILMVHLNVQDDENKSFPPLHYIVYSFLNKNIAV